MGKEQLFTKNLSHDGCHTNFLDSQPFALKHLSLRDMVVTPDRVPKFTIPPLCQSRRPGFPQCATDRETTALGSSRRHTMPWLALSSLRDRQVKSCAGGAEARVPQCCCNDISADPATRAAMSLPHLTKITTPYGFLALGESPCVPRRESLFFECHGQSVSLDVDTKGPQRPVHRPLRRQSYSLTDIENIPHQMNTPVRSVSCDAASRLHCATERPKNLPVGTYGLSDSCLSAHVGPPTSLSGKGRFKRVLKKRLAAVRAFTQRC